MLRELLIIKRNFDFLDTVEAVYFKLSTDLCQQLLTVSNCKLLWMQFFVCGEWGFFALSSTSRQGKGLNAMNREIGMTSQVMSR